MDIAEFDDKNQHVLMPTSLISGTIGLVAEKTRDHVLSKKKDTIVGAAAASTTTSETDCETDAESPNTTSSKRPTIIDFMDKFKTKRSINSNDDWGCSSNFSLAEVIAEHTVEKNFDKKNDEIVTPEHELEEVANGGLNERPKRSNDDKDVHSIPTPCGSSFCSIFSLQKPQQTEQSQSTCSTGTCDRIET